MGGATHTQEMFSQKEIPQKELRTMDRQSVTNYMQNRIKSAVIGQRPPVVAGGYSNADPRGATRDA